MLNDPEKLLKIQVVGDDLRGFRQPRQIYQPTDTYGVANCVYTRESATKKMLKMKGPLDELLKTKGQKKCSG